MSLTKLVLTAAAPVPRPEAFSRYLFVGPHPDDIEIGCGATVAKLSAAGKEIIFLIVTDGRYGDGLAGGIRGNALAALRRQEAIHSAASLGVTNVRFLDLCDGGFYSYKEMLAALARVTGEVRPDLIFAPDPATGRECHIDHRNAGRAAAHISCMAPYQGIMERYGAKAAPVEGIAFYMTARPNRFVRTGREDIRAQAAAIFKYHKSQFPEGSREAQDLAAYLKLRSADFGLRSLSLHAEGFRVLGKAHMHCLPEPV